MKILFALNLSSPVADMGAIFRALPFAKVDRCEGCYKGESEASYSIQGNTETLKAIIKLARKHNQESILVVNDDNQAKLIYCETLKAEKLPGKWQPIEKDFLPYLEAYTIIKNEYFAVI